MARTKIRTSTEFIIIIFFLDTKKFRGGRGYPGTPHPEPRRTPDLYQEGLKQRALIPRSHLYGFTEEFYRSPTKQGIAGSED